jgi:hypothetical protein
MGASDDVLIDQIRQFILQAIYKSNSESELSKRYMSVEAVRMVNL